MKPATANGNKAGQNEIGTCCNKACTHLKELVDDMREAGKYLFWRNPGLYQRVLETKKQPQIIRRAGTENKNNKILTNYQKRRFL